MMWKKITAIILAATSICLSGCTTKKIQQPEEGIVNIYGKSYTVTDYKYMDRSLYFMDKHNCVDFLKDGMVYGYAYDEISNQYVFYTIDLELDDQASRGREVAGNGTADYHVRKNSLAEKDGKYYFCAVKDHDEQFEQDKTMSLFCVDTVKHCCEEVYTNSQVRNYLIDTVLFGDNIYFIVAGGDADKTHTDSYLKCYHPETGEVTDFLTASSNAATKEGKLLITVSSNEEYLAVTYETYQENEDDLDGVETYTDIYDTDLKLVRTVSILDDVIDYYNAAGDGKTWESSGIVEVVPHNDYLICQNYSNSTAILDKNGKVIFGPADMFPVEHIIDNEKLFFQKDGCSNYLYYFDEQKQEMMTVWYAPLGEEYGINGFFQDGDDAFITFYNRKATEEKNKRRAIFVHIDDILQNLKEDTEE